MKLALAVVLAVVFIAAGAVLGQTLRPGHETEHVPAPPEPDSAGTPTAVDKPVAYVKIGGQMVVPVVAGGATRALMLFEIAVDVPPEIADLAYAREPRLQDAFLREMFEMSYTGAFLDTYTDDRIVRELREKLLATARVHLGPQVRDVLILDILRKEM